MSDAGQNLASGTWTMAARVAISEWTSDRVKEKDDIRGAAPVRSGDRDMRHFIPSRGTVLLVPSRGIALLIPLRGTVLRAFALNAGNRWLYRQVGLCCDTTIPCACRNGITKMKKRPDSIDVLVGNNIRILRLERGLSQSDLADRLGITFQQIQKYEKGINRIGSSRLARLSQVLGVSVGRFFQGSEMGISVDMPPETLTGLLTKPYAIRMLKALANVSNNGARLSLVQLAESMAGTDEK